MRIRFAARLAATLALAGTAAIFSVASPAQAFIGLYRVAAISALDATSPKNVTTTCNAGDDLVSVGGRINDGFGDVLLTRAYLDAAGTSATASGIEAIATNVPWSVEVFAVCAPAGALANRTVVQATSATNPNDKFQSAVCPAGDELVGAGYLLQNANGAVSIDEVLFTGVTTVSVTSYNNAAVGNYSLVVQAVCADPLPMRSIQTDISASNAISPKTMTSPTCPAGSQVSAVGTVITGALGAASIATLNPRPQLLAGESTAREVGAFGGNWTSQIQTVCIG